MAEATQRRRAGPGRPRLRPAPAERAGLSAREEILDAAAGLFVSQGVTGTTTRQIAEHVGIRQASLYYYFSGKDEILLELLTLSVRPSLRVACRLEALASAQGDLAAGLYALALTDVRALSRTPHNIASLYLLPEVRGGGYASFHTERAELQAIYGRLGHAVSAVASLDPSLTGTLLMQLVESVVPLRNDGRLHAGYAHEIAAACLRLTGMTPAAVADARRAAAGLLTRVRS